MLIRFLKHGTGSGAAAAAYLTQAVDWKGQEREDVEVLRGDPAQVAAVADSLDFKHKYTSAIIAWAPEDKPTDEQIERTVDEFEQFAWAGMEPDRYAWTAVKHRDPGGGVHVHVVAARCDLATGRSLNIAPPNWERQYAALRDYLNDEHGWRSPKDPARARALQPGYKAYLDVALRTLRAVDGNADRDAQELVRAAVVLGSAARAAMRTPRPRALVEKARVRARMAEQTNPRRLLTRFLRQELERGTVTDRGSMVATLKQAGFDVTRQGRDYITVADPDSTKRWRMQGAIYNQHFQAARWLEQRERAAEKRRKNVPTNGTAERISSRAEMERHRRARREYLQQLPSARGARAPTAAPTSQSRGDRAPAALSVADIRAHRRDRWERRDAFHRRVASCISSSIIKTSTLVRNLKQSGLEVSYPDQDYLAVRDPDSGQRAGIKLSMAGDGYSCQLQGEDQIPADQSHQESNDRTRTPVDESLAGVERAVQEGSARARGASHSLKRASRELGRGLQEHRAGVDGYAQAIEQVLSQGHQRRPRGPSRSRP